MSVHNKNSAHSVQPFSRPEGTFIFISCFIIIYLKNMERKDKMSDDVDDDEEGDDDDRLIYLKEKDRKEDMSDDDDDKGDDDERRRKKKTRTVFSRSQVRNIFFSY